MKLKILLTLMVAFLFLHSCATSPTTKLEAVASMDQKTAYDGTIISQKKHLVSLSPYPELDNAITEIGLAKDKIKFMLTVQNCGEEQIDIGYDNISVIFEGTGMDQTSNKIDIQSVDEFMRDFDKEYYDDEKEFIYSTLYEVWTLCKYGGMDSETATYKMLDFKYDIEDMRRQYEVLHEILPGVILRQQTIMPGDNYTGIVICDTRDLDPEKEGKFRIAVSVDGEEHGFTFNRDL